MRRLHAVLAGPCSLDVVLRFSNSFILSEHPTYILLFTLIERRYGSHARRAAIPACVSFHLPPPFASSLHSHSPPVSSMFGFLLGHDLGFFGHTRSIHTNQDSPGLGRSRVRHVFRFQDFRTAEFAYADRLHREVMLSSPNVHL